MRKFGFPPKLRLRRGAEFKWVLSKGRSVASSALCVSLALRPPSAPTPAGENFPRLGVAIGKAVGSSVVRNRIRRRLREIFRLRRMEIKDGLDLLIRPRPPAAHLNYRELERELWGLLRRAGALR